MSDRTAEVEEVYRRVGNRLWRSVLAYSGDGEVASDSVAEAFAQVLNRGDDVRDVEAWVWRAAFRIAAGELKRRRDWVPHPPEQPTVTPDTPFPLLEGLRALSDRQRACVVLRYYGGFSSNEIAKVVGSSPGVVRVQLTRGRRQLRRYLEGER